MTKLDSNRLLQEAMRALRFGVTGVGGFVVDAAILALMVDVIGSGPVASRLVSAPIAILCTFACNRYWSFANIKKRPIASSFASYVSTQGTGFLCNLAVYFVTLPLVPSPVFALVIASAAAMLINYLGARFWVFKAVD